MDLIFNWAYYGIANSDHIYWNEAFETFANPLGISTHGTIYGMSLRPGTIGAFNLGDFKLDNNKYNERSDQLFTENIEIYDIMIAPEEIISTKDRNGIKGPIPYNKISDNQFYPHTQSVYQNNILYDCIITMTKLSNNWIALQNTWV